VDESGIAERGTVRPDVTAGPTGQPAAVRVSNPPDVVADETAVDALLHAAHLAAPHELPGLVSEHAAQLGARDAVILLADLQQNTLVPFAGPGGPTDGSAPLQVDSTIAGRCYQLVQVITQDVEDALKVWLPLVDGTQRLGVLAVTVAGLGHGGTDCGLAGDGPVGDRPDVVGPDDRLLVRLRRFAALAAALLVNKSAYGDSVLRVRRRGDMDLAAEIQWGLLPPQTFACSQLVIAAALEPAYEVAGDSVDYAVDVDHAWFAVFDGMGHGLQSAQLATVSVAAYRNARRSGRSLADAAAAIDDAVLRSFAGEAFTTAVLADLDTTTGLLTWINVGHLEPLLLRHHHVVKQLHSSPSLPFGLGLSPAPTYSLGTEHLQRGDHVLLYTDGVTDASSPSGQPFGLERLVDLVTRNLTAELPLNETLRRTVRELVAHQQAQLRDDATLLLVHWSGETHVSLLP
jgi:hypothetical protein